MAAIAIAIALAGRGPPAAKARKRCRLRCPVRRNPVDPPRHRSRSATPPDAADRRQNFLNRGVDRSTTAADRLQAPPSPHVLQAGSAIEAALIAGLCSDLPGQIGAKIGAQIAANVHDGPTGRFLPLDRIPLNLPDSSSVELERQPGTDEAGYAGLKDRVDNHWGRLVLAARRATVLDIDAKLDQDDDDGIARAICEETRDTIDRAGDVIARRQIPIAPTLRNRPALRLCGPLEGTLHPQVGQSFGRRERQGHCARKRDRKLPRCRGACTMTSPTTREPCERWMSTNLRLTWAMQATSRMAPDR